VIEVRVSVKGLCFCCGLRELYSWLSLGWKATERRSQRGLALLGRQVRTEIQHLSSIILKKLHSVAEYYRKCSTRCVLVRCRGDYFFLYI
jgi:hypothetical protein